MNANVDCWRIHYTYDDDESKSTKIVAAEYRIVLLGVHTPITETMATDAKHLVESNVKRFRFIRIQMKKGQ